MKPSSMSSLLHSLQAAALFVAGLFGINASQAATLFTCSATNYGNPSSFGFYMPSYPGISLDTATLRLWTPTGSGGAYNVLLTVRSNTYDGPILGSASASVALGSASLTPVTFVYPSLRLVQGIQICFILSVITGPADPVYYLVGSCPEVVQTQDTTPPLSTFRHYGVDLTLTGARSLQVTNSWSIQAAINAAQPGETVAVGPGTYSEDITLKSGVNVIGSGYGLTIIRGSGSNAVVTASSITSARLSGFTITHSTNRTDAGLYIAGGNLMVDNNRFVSNANGIRIIGGSSTIIRNNLIETNGDPAIPYVQYGIICLSSTPLIANNLIQGNHGVGIYFAWAESTGAQCINNTVANNTDEGIWCYQQANVVIKNNIISGNGVGIDAIYEAVPQCTFNDVWGNSWQNYQSDSGGLAAPGLGSISADPLFDTNSPARFALSLGSPCIHTGDPDPTYDNPDGTRNTMGAYGGPGAMSPAEANGITTGFLFTSVGLVPTAVITNSGPLAGLANIPSNVAAALYLPPWKDAPFGGGLYLHGLFGSSDTAVQYYQILAAPWEGGSPPAATNFQPVLDPLNKYKYVILSNGVVQMNLVNVGPNANGLYQRTDRPDSGYWSSPDLKLILNSYRLLNTKYDFICVAYTNGNLSSKLALPTNQLSRITLWIDNNPVTVSINTLRDQSSNAIPECGIIQVATNMQNLQFEITVSHPTGFLDYYSLGSYYGRNHYGGAVTSDQYVGAHDGSRPTWGGPGTLTVSSQPAQLAGRLQPWQTCAYQFTLGAVARTINGFDRIYGTWFSDHYYITVGAPVPSCVADLNADGRVDGADLAIFATRFGLTNCVAAPLK